MRLNAKAGKQTTIKLDKRQGALLINAIFLCRTIGLHANEPVRTAACKTAEQLESLVKEFVIDTSPKIE